jgi:hypothetical protein
MVLTPMVTPMMKGVGTGAITGVSEKSASAHTLALITAPITF